MRMFKSYIASFIVAWLSFFTTYYTHVDADFIYEDFNQTLGLNINGDAATSGCNISDRYIYSDGEKTNHSTPTTNDPISANVIVGKDGGLQSRQTVVTNTNDAKDDQLINELEAKFGHRDAYVPRLNNGCRRRLRLTPSSPSKAGSVFYERRLPVVSL